MAEQESPLQLASQIYAPFTRAEVGRLRHFVDDVEGLAKSSLFSEQQNVFHLSAKINGPLEQKLDYNGEEAIHAVVGRFRQLYNAHEPSSYNQILKLLGKHVHDRESSFQREALDALKELRNWEKEVRKAALRSTSTEKCSPARSSLTCSFMATICIRATRSPTDSKPSHCEECC
jgi:hypothetical protein